MRWLNLLIVNFFLCGSVSAATEFSDSWSKTKKRSEKLVYFDHHETLYCGCTYELKGVSGGVPNHTSCGFENRPGISDTRATRIEWEHIVPTSLMPARQHECWTESGREECERNGPDNIKMMIFDLHNLAPSVGQINADRSNRRYGLLTDVEPQFGQCPFKYDIDLRLAEPSEEVRGNLARVWFYMRDRYGVLLTDGEEAMFRSWDEVDPVSDWERLRNARIFCAQGTSNSHVASGIILCPGSP